MSKEIPLTQGKIAIVDDEDFEEISRYKWYATKGKNTWYAQRHPRPANGQHNIWMHREIAKRMGLALEGIGIDHINGDGVDNQRINLRLATSAQNAHNQHSNSSNKTGLKGVSWESRRKKWRAQIRVNGINIALGNYTDPIEAARAYDRAAIAYFGEFAWTNERRA